MSRLLGWLALGGMGYAAYKTYQKPSDLETKYIIRRQLHLDNRIGDVHDFEDYWTDEYEPEFWEAYYFHGIEDYSDDYDGDYFPSQLMEPSKFYEIWSDAE